MRAAQKGVVETIRILLSSGADVNRRGRHSETALMLACQRGDEATVRILLAAPGVDPLLYMPAEVCHDPADHTRTLTSEQQRVSEPPVLSAQEQDHRGAVTAASTRTSPSRTPDHEVPPPSSSASPRGSYPFPSLHYDSIVYDDRGVALDPGVEAIATPPGGVRAVGGTRHRSGTYTRREEFHQGTMAPRAFSCDDKDDDGRGGAWDHETHQDVDMRDRGFDSCSEFDSDDDAMNGEEDYDDSCEDNDGSVDDDSREEDFRDDDDDDEDSGDVVDGDDDDAVQRLESCVAGTVAGTVVEGGGARLQIWTAASIAREHGHLTCAALVEQAARAGRMSTMHHLYHPQPATPTAKSASGGYGGDRDAGTSREHRLKSRRCQRALLSTHPSTTTQTPSSQVQRLVAEGSYSPLTSPGRLRKKTKQNADEETGGDMCGAHPARHPLLFSSSSITSSSSSLSCSFKDFIIGGGPFLTSPSKTSKKVAPSPASGFSAPLRGGPPR